MITGLGLRRLARGGHDPAAMVRALLVSALLMLPCVLQAQTAADPTARLNNEAVNAIIEAYDKGDYQEALAKLDALAGDGQPDPLLLNLYGSVHTKMEDYDKASEYFDQALEIQPGYFPAVFNKGEILFLQKKYPEARAYFESMRESDRRNELLQFKVVLCNLELGEEDTAKRIMNAIKYPGDSPAWHYAQAAWELKHGDKGKARRLVRGARFIYGEKTALFDETFHNLGYPVD